MEKNSIENKKESSLHKLGSIVAVTGVQGVWEHACEVFKVRKQNDPSRSYKDITSTMIKNGLFQEVTKGASSNLARAFMKQAYRNPIAMAGKEAAEKLLPEETKKNNPNLTTNLGKTTMVVADPLLLNTVEVIKTQHMTTPGKISTLEVIKKTPIKTYTKGLNAMAARQGTYWGGTFLVEGAVKKHTGKNELSPSERAISSTAIGITTTAFNMPFDVAKTKLQAKDSPYNTMTEVFKDFGTQIRTNGVKAIKLPVTGYIPRALLGIGTTFANTYALNKTVGSSENQR